MCQLLAQCVLLACTNVAGVMTHYPSELAKRQAFLETRQCVEARLSIQRENQQQVSNRYTYCVHSRVDAYRFGAYQLVSTALGKIRPRQN